MILDTVVVLAVSWSASSRNNIYFLPPCQQAHQPYDRCCPADGIHCCVADKNGRQCFWTRSVQPGGYQAINGQSVFSSRSYGGLFWISNHGQVASIEHLAEYVVIVNASNVKQPNDGDKTTTREPGQWQHRRATTVTAKKKQPPANNIGYLYCQQCYSRQVPWYNNYPTQKLTAINDSIYDNHQ